MTTENQKATKKSTKIILIIALIALAIGGFFGIRFYATYFAPNVTDAEKHLYIKTGSTYEQLVSELRTKNILNDIDAFERAALKMNLKSRIKPGKYRLEKGMGNRALINKLKSGNQEPVSFKFHNIRKKENFAAYLGKNLETDSLTFIHYLDSAAFAAQYGFNTETFYTMFIPNTYEFYWNVAPKDFFDRMHKEYEKFWNADRKAKAEKLGLTPAQVTTLASIVDSEALFDREMRTIAGLYLNRLEKGILLQADPTVIFANNDFSVRRVTGKLLAIDSKYNTYKYAGLPPGPITMPSINAIDAVLNREQNNYIYMCAKEDFSGYHNFAVTKAEHEVNAKKYREALNQRNIFR